MNRLWLRLALMIGGVLFLMFFLQFVAIMIDMDNRPAVEVTASREDDPLHADRTEIAVRLLGFAGLSLVVGAIGGVLISMAVSLPVRRLSWATARIAAGELGVKVPVKGAREFQELAVSFNVMAASLATAEDQRRNLVADISHELRTPLTVLNGSLRAALDGVYFLDEAEISRLCQQTGYLIRLVNDLRELSLAEAGKLPLRLEPVDLRELGEECLLDLRPLAADRLIALAADWDSLPELNLDALRIRQILVNLLANAIRHSPDGATVLLSGRHRKLELELAVTDQGEGLDAKQVTAVFDRFYRADPSRSRESGGSGIGLTISRALARAQGGNLLASSAGPGKGACFTLVLPVPKT